MIKHIITCKTNVTIATTHLSVAFFPSLKLCVCVYPETRIDNTEYHMMCQSQHEGAVTLSPCVRHGNNCAIDCNLPSSSGLDSERRHDLKGVNPEPKGEGREMYC